MKKLTISLIGLFLIIGFFTNTAYAQWGIGASYEIRNESPQNGFGVRVEKGILSSVPLLDFQIRGHFSSFSEENSVTREGIAFDREFEVYDFGAALVAGVSLGVVKPYVGAGLGSERYRFDSMNIALGSVEGSFSESNYYWNGFGGAEMTLLPFLKPFIEFRYSKLFEPDDIEFDQVSRLAIGVNFRF